MKLNNKIALITGGNRGWVGILLSVLLKMRLM
jgi:hypothetical protein